ncbi:HSFY1 protein, partial [Rhinopomastus cyanomelas]|nr:HSFY1 protein [Rhinopomastus cyanomelas]
FPQALWKALESNQFPSIWWSDCGKSVAIHKELFKADMLGRVFAAKKMKTFIRQLNQRGFKKLKKDFQRSPSLPEFLAEEAAFSTHGKILYYYHPGFKRQLLRMLKTCKRR